MEAAASGTIASSLAAFEEAMPAVLETEESDDEAVLLGTAGQDASTGTEDLAEADWPMPTDDGLFETVLTPPEPTESVGLTAAPLSDDAAVVPGPLLTAAPQEPAAPSPIAENTSPAVDAEELLQVLGSGWSEPTSLLERLEDLAGYCETGAWAIDSSRLVRRLARVVREHSDEDRELIAAVVAAAEEAEFIGAGLANPSLATACRRAGMALGRHAAIWDLASRASNTPEMAQLLATIERFESGGALPEAHFLAGSIARLAQSPRAVDQELAGYLENVYRNANLRVCLTADLLNRLAPQPGAERAPVRDVILGVPVVGTSVAGSQIQVQFIPDPQRVRMAFLVQGQVSALTTADAGLASFVNSSQAWYSARKELELLPHGIHVEGAEVAVSNQTQLRSVDTVVDWVPIIGWLAQNAARIQHEQSRSAANEESRMRVYQRAKQRIDEEVYGQLNAAVDRLRTQVFLPIHALGLMPDILDGQTTTERLTARWRMATDVQVGSHTPRPMAPADSRASLQIHESGINNLIDRLELAGKTFALPELSQYVAAKLQRPSAWTTDPEHDDLYVTFAADEALRVRCQDGLMTIHLSLAELKKGSRAWRDFEVRASYAPQVNGRSVQLVREGVVQLIGPRLAGRGQIAVRGIFSRVFSKNRTWELVPAGAIDDPRLEGLVITQCEIDDGWIAMALGPQ